jgi:DNA-binding phage protein
MMTDVYEKFNMCDATELAAFFSCFTNVNVAEEIKTHSPNCKATRTLQLMEIAGERLDHYYREETAGDIYSGESYAIHYDLADDVVAWCDCKTEEECERFLLQLQRDKGIFIGEFVKAVLQINAMAKELEKISEICGLTDILYTLSQIGELTLKSVCTSQSLYV